MLRSLILVAAFAASAASAQEAITVTAPRIDPATVEPAAQAYVKGVLPTPVLGQYARWQVPVCIKVIGLEDAVAARVARRITSIAQGSKIGVARPGCQPNLIVFFSNDSRRDVAAILAKKPSSAKGISADDRKRLLEAPLPVRWWHTTQAGNGDGSGMTRDASALSTGQFLNSDGGGTGLGGPGADATASYSSSLIDTHLSVGIIYAAAAVDVPLANGRSLDAVASYVATVTLAAVPLDVVPPGVPSILSLFADPPAGTDRLPTDWDKAYLDALYRIAMNRRATAQRGQLITAMTKQLKP
jgi:hypothetical protein